MKPALLVPVPLLAFAAFLALRMRSAPLHLVPAVAPAGAVPAAEPAGPVPVRVAAPLFVTDTIVLPSLPQVRIVRPLRPLRAPFVERVGGGDRRYAVRDELSIGRAPSNGLVLDDPKVSRNHALIVMLDTGAVLRDLNSANGTEVNGARISADQPLHDGDAITVGDTSFIFHNDFETAKPRLERRDNGKEYHITPQTIGIGRAPDNTIVLDDPKVSRRHAQLAIREGQVIIRDLESLNGTLVNNEYVVGDHPLRNGDTVTIGDAPFVFHNDFDVARVP
jgi:pSer/pThr/pTyr-binding forkhead associated (FHA) protein